jgi:hypothetical protein
MSNIKNKKKKRIVRDMKECFRSLHLPIDENISVQGNPMNVEFTSQLCNDHVCAAVAVIYDEKEGYIGIDVSFLHIKVPSEKMAEILKLLNLMNGIRPICCYSVCHCCNTISWRSGLFLSGEVLPKEKFRRLIQEMLEDTYLCAPLIEDVVKSGNHNVLYDRFMDDHKDVMKTDGISKGVKSQILGDMESVITGLKISIKEDLRLGNGFVIDGMLQGMDFPLCMGITLDNEDEMVILNQAPSFTVPDEKIPVMTELVNRINRMTGPDHLFINRQTKRVVLLKAIMIDNGVLDKKEFENSFRMLLGNGSIFFPIIKEQIASNKSPEVLLAKIRENYKDSH